MKRQDPQIPTFLSEIERFDPKDGLISGVRLRKQKQVGLSGLDLRACVFEKCSFQNGRADHAAFTDVVFRDCDLSGLDCTGASFVRCAMIDCKGVGLRAIESYWHHVLIQGGAYSYANFSTSTLRSCELRAAWMPNVSFTDCTLSGFLPTNAVLTGVDFFGTPLAGVDFRNAQIDGLTCAGRELNGVIVNALEAAGLAKIFGLDVRD